MSLKCSNNRSAFSLLELIVIISVASVLVVTKYSVDSHINNTQKFIETEKKIEAIKVAVAAYYAKYNRFPCPADFSINVKDRDVGISKINIIDNSVCNINTLSSDQSFYVGSVPVKQLGLSYEYMLDAWGNRLNYIAPVSVSDSFSVNPQNTLDSTIYNPANDSNVNFWIDASDLDTVTMNESLEISEIFNKADSELLGVSQNETPIKYNIDNDIPSFEFDGNSLTSTYCFKGRQLLNLFVVYQTNENSKQKIFELSNHFHFSLDKAAFEISLLYNVQEERFIVSCSFYGCSHGFILVQNNMQRTFVKDSFPLGFNYTPSKVNILSSMNFFDFMLVFSDLYLYNKDIDSLAFVEPIGLADLPFEVVDKSLGYYNQQSCAKIPGFTGKIYELILYDSTDSFSSLEARNLAVSINKYLSKKWIDGSFDIQTGGPFMVIKDIDGNVIETEALVAIVSYGPTGKGAYTKSGVQKQPYDSQKNMFSNGFDSQNIITDLKVVSSKLSKRKGFAKDFTQIVRFVNLDELKKYTVSE